MLGRCVRAALVCALVCVLAGAAFAADIVTVPTANQLKAGEIDVAAYYIGVKDLPPIDFVRVQTLYVGLTDRLEVDVHRYDLDVAGDDTIFIASYLIQPETPEKPAVVLGGRDLSRVFGNASYYVSAAKTLNPPVGGPPTGPIYRLHVSLGTEDDTLFGEERHEGLFGGLQVLAKPTFPQVGVIGLYDGQDLITGVTFTKEPTWPTLKAGTFGDHWWVGANYTFNMR